MWRRPLSLQLAVLLASGCTAVWTGCTMPSGTEGYRAPDTGPPRGADTGFGETPPWIAPSEPEPPPGWRTVASIEGGCSLYAPASERIAPSPPAWVERACEAPLPRSARCRYLDGTWPRNVGAQVRPAEKQPFTIAVSNHEGRPSRWLFALPLDDDGGRGRLVFDGDVDGTPRFMFRSRGECELRGAVDSARFVLSVRAWRHHYGPVNVNFGGTHEAPLDMRTLALDAYAWAMPSDLGAVERLPARLGVVPWERARARPLFFAYEARTYSEVSVVTTGSRIFFGGAGGGRRSVYASIEGGLAQRLLPPAGQEGTHAGAFGTDGKEAFWLEGEDPAVDGVYAAIHAVGGVLGSGRDALAAGARRIAALGAGRIGEEPSIVGCGMAAAMVAAPTSSRPRLTIVRIADGTKVEVAGEEEGAPLPYVRPVALFCSELLATIIEEEGEGDEAVTTDLRVPRRRETIVRVALRELGPFR